MEHGRAVGFVFGHCAFRAPVDERVAVGKELHAALRLCQKAIWRLEGLHDARCPGSRVDSDDFTLREGMRVQFCAATALRAVR